MLYMYKQYRCGWMFVIHTDCIYFECVWCMVSRVHPTNTQLCQISGKRHGMEISPCFPRNFPQRGGNANAMNHHKPFEDEEYHPYGHFLGVPRKISQPSSIYRWDFPWNKPSSVLLGYLHFANPHRMIGWFMALGSGHQGLRYGWRLSRFGTAKLTSVELSWP